MLNNQLQGFERFGLFLLKTLEIKSIEGVQYVPNLTRIRTLVTFRKIKLQLCFAEALQEVTQFLGGKFAGFFAQSSVPVQHSKQHRARRSKLFDS